MARAKEKKVLDPEDHFKIQLFTEKSKSYKSSEELYKLKIEYIKSQQKILERDKLLIDYAFVREKNEFELEKSMHEKSMESMTTKYGLQSHDWTYDASSLEIISK